MQGALPELITIFERMNHPIGLGRKVSDVGRYVLWSGEKYRAEENIVKLPQRRVQNLVRRAFYMSCGVVS
jgi:hypothetical protein